MLTTIVSRPFLDYINSIIECNVVVCTHGILMRGNFGQVKYVVIKIAFGKGGVMLQ